MTYKLTNTSINPDPYYGAVSLLLSGDGANNSTDIWDSSLNTKVVTAVADAKISTAQSKWNGSSIAFDGSGDYLTVPSSAAFEFGTGDFTIEGWWRRTSDTLGGILDFGMNYGGIGIYQQLDVDYSPLLVVRVAGTDIITTPIFSANQFVHLALSRSGTSLRLFYDGAQQGSTVSNSTNLVNTFGTVAIGAFVSGGSFFHTPAANLDDIRITKSIARYTSNFTPPTQPFQAFIRPDQDPYFYATSLLLHGDGANGSTNIVDSSPTPKTVTAYGDAQISTAQSKFSGSSLAFDGSGDYLSAGDFADHYLSGVPFTVEAWIYPTSYASGASFNEGRTVVGKWNDTGIPAGWRLEINTSSIFWYTNTTIRHSTAISLNQWTHIAVCGDGTTSSMYKNGVKVSGPSSDVFSNSTGKNLIIGALLFGQFEYYFDGYIDDLRITKSIARYNSNFSPPPAPFPNF